MLTTVFVSVFLVAALLWAGCFVRLLYRASIDEPLEQKPTPTPAVETLAITTAYLESILQFRQETIELIQMTDLRLMSFDMLPDERRETFPESFNAARVQNHWAKLAYNDYDFEHAAKFAQLASKEMQRAQDTINQSV